VTAAGYDLSERTMPVRNECEKAILGGILLDNRHLPEVAAALKVDDLALSAHRRIYTAMLSLMEQGKSADIVTIVAELEGHHEADSVGGPDYIYDLTIGVPDRPSLKSYIDRVKQAAQRRAAITLCDQAIGRLLDQTVPQKETFEVLQTELLSIQANVAKRPLVWVKDATLEALHAMEQQHETGLTTGLADLDFVTDGGIRPEELWIIGGDPGSGKSALASQIAAENARLGRKVAMFSIEMKTNRVMRRLWCYKSGVFYSKLKHPPSSLSPTDRKLFDDAVDAVCQWPIEINDASDLSPQEFVSQARLAVVRDKVELVILDHIQIMMENVRGKDIIEKIGKIVGPLRQFSKDYCPVVALSQLTRESKDQRNKRPTIQDLYGGRMLEANASVIAMLWRPKNDLGKATGEDEIILRKNREGEPDVIVPAEFKGGLMRFEPRVGGAQ